MFLFLVVVQDTFLEWLESYIFGLSGHHYCGFRVCVDYFEVGQEKSGMMCS